MNQLGVWPGMKCLDYQCRREKLKAVKGDHDVLHFTSDAYLHNFTFDLSPCCQQKQQALQVRWSRFGYRQ